MFACDRQTIIFRVNDYEFDVGMVAIMVRSGCLLCRVIVN